MFRSLILILFFAFAPATLVAAEQPPLPVLSNDQAWKRLNGKPGQEQPLPAWARMLAGPLPFATARMLELDALHRSGDRLDARLRCLARRAAAGERLRYSKAVAVSDYRRAASQLDLKRGPKPQATVRWIRRPLLRSKNDAGLCGHGRRSDNCWTWQEERLVAW